MWKLIRLLFGSLALTFTLAGGMVLIAPAGQAAGYATGAMGNCQMMGSQHMNRMGSHQMMGSCHMRDSHYMTMGSHHMMRYSYANSGYGCGWMMNDDR
jgi:hypothetical protein